jgi:adenine-specific DNA methylase
MTALPPTYYLHVWRARRPLVASRAAILASLLPEDANREKFLHMAGIHGDSIASRKRIDAARRKGERIEGEANSYPRAFSYVPDEADRKWFAAARSSASMRRWRPTVPNVRSLRGTREAPATR